MPANNWRDKMAQAKARTHDLGQRDPEFEQVLKRFEFHVQRASDLQSELKALLEAVRRLSGACTEVGRAMHAFCGNSILGPDGRPSPLRNVFDDLAAIESRALPQMNADFYNQVFGGWVTYTDFLRQLKSRADQREFFRKECAWYASKLERVGEKKGTAYYIKNQAKLEFARANFTAMDNNLVETLSLVLANAPSALMRIAPQFGTSCEKYFGIVTEECVKMQNAITSCRYNEDPTHAALLSKSTEGVRILEATHKAWKQTEVSRTMKLYSIEESREQNKPPALLRIVSKALMGRSLSLSRASVNDQAESPPPLQVTQSEGYEPNSHAPMSPLSSDLSDDNDNEIQFASKISLHKSQSSNAAASSSNDKSGAKGRGYQGNNDDDDDDEMEEDDQTSPNNNNDNDSNNPKRHSIPAIVATTENDDAVTVASPDWSKDATTTAQFDADPPQVASTSTPSTLNNDAVAPSEAASHSPKLKPKLPVRHRSSDKTSPRPQVALQDFPPPPPPPVAATDGAPAIESPPTEVLENASQANNVPKIRNEAPPTTPVKMRSDSMARDPKHPRLSIVPPPIADRLRMFQELSSIRREQRAPSAVEESPEPDLTALNISLLVAETSEPEYASEIWARALYSYEAQSPDELSFTAGDVLKIVYWEDEWWDAEIDGRIGLVPSNFLDRVVR